jgi:hypothetical protein
MTQWVPVCNDQDIEMEDVIRFDHNGRTYAVYRSPEGEFFATDGLAHTKQSIWPMVLWLMKRFSAPSITVALTTRPDRPVVRRSASI